MAYTDYLDTVQKIYIGYLQRPADPGGLLYWAAKLDASGGNLNAIIAAFANSAESTALYGTIDSSNISTVVDDIYNALFGRHAEQAGLDFWVDGFNSGRFTAATIMLNVLDGAQNEDLLSVNNKVTASNLFTKTIDPELDGRDFQYTYSGDADAQAGREWLALITWDPATIPYPWTPFPLVPFDPSDYTLTTGADNIVNGAGNDTINAPLSDSMMTFGSLDKIDGGAGTDTMTISINGTGVYSASTLSNVENIWASFLGTGGTLDLTNATGVSSVTVVVYTTNPEVNGLAAGTALAFEDRNGNIEGDDVTFNFASGALSGSADEITLTVSGVIKDFGPMLPLFSLPFTHEINLGNGIETLNVVSSGGVTNRVGALNDTGATATISKIVITGDTGLEIAEDALESTVKIVDASTATGALSFIVGSTTSSTVTGGSGNDTIMGGSGNDVINGGAGNDTIANVLTGNANTAADVLTGGAGFDTFILRGDLTSEAVATAYAKAAYITDFTVGGTATTTDILQLSATIGNYSGGTAFFAGVAAAAAGATTIQTVAQNAAATPIVTGTDLIKLTTPVATTGLTVQQAFNNAIGTGTVTGLVAANDIFFSLYDSTNSRMLVGLVDAGVADTVIATGDVVTLVGTVTMTAADYAAFNQNNLSIITTTIEPI